MKTKFGLKFILTGIFICSIFLPVILFTGCPNKPEAKEAEEFVITFGIEGSGGYVEAAADGVKLNSGEKVKKGTIVVFTAKPLNENFAVAGWTGRGVLQDPDKKVARLMVLSAVDVRVNFTSSLINFITVRGGTQKGADTKITDEQALKILSGKTDVIVEVRGPDASIVIGSTEKVWEPDSFKVNGKKEFFMAYGNLKSAGVATVMLPEINKETDVTAEVIAEGVRHEIRFKIKRLEGKVDVPRLHLVIDGNKPEPMENDTLEKLFDGVSKPVFNSEDPAKIEVQTTGDFMQSVTVTPADGTAESGAIGEKTLPAGKVWYAEIIVGGLEDAGAEGKEFKVEITPKDTVNYSPVVWTFKLKAKDKESNAQFQGTQTSGGFEPAIIRGVKWYNDPEPHKYTDDYGAKSVKFTAHTVSKNASVHYQIIGIDKKPLPGQTEMIMTNKKDAAHSHVSEEIPMFEDKPTYVKLWVIAADGVTTDDEKGVWIFNGNPANVRFGYEFKDDPMEIRKPESGYKQAYDVIEIDRSKVKDDKVYAAFSIWDSFNVAETGLPPHQKKFVKFTKQDETDAWLAWYCTEVNISGLTSESDLLEIQLPILEKGVPCFTYKVKLKLAR